MLWAGHRQNNVPGDEGVSGMELILEWDGPFAISFREHKVQHKVFHLQASNMSELATGSLVAVLCNMYISIFEHQFANSANEKSSPSYVANQDCKDTAYTNR